MSLTSFDLRKVLQRRAQRGLLSFKKINNSPLLFLHGSYTSASLSDAAAGRAVTVAAAGKESGGCAA